MDPTHPMDLQWDLGRHKLPFEEIPEPTTTQLEVLCVC